MARRAVKRRADWRAIRKHRSYRVDEAARALGVCKATVRRWIKQGLPVVSDGKPMLILGRDLIAFLQKRRRPKQQCEPEEFYCFRCRTPKRAAFGEAEIVHATATSVNLRALCENCAAVMHKRASLRKLAALAAILTIQSNKRTDT